MNHGRPRIENPIEPGEHRAEVELALAADVEEAGPEAEGDGEAGEDQRRGRQERLADRVEGRDDLVDVARGEGVEVRLRAAERPGEEGARRRPRRPRSTAPSAASGSDVQSASRSGSERTMTNAPKTSAVKTDRTGTRSFRRSPRRGVATARLPRAQLGAGSRGGLGRRLGDRLDGHDGGSWPSGGRSWSLIRPSLPSSRRAARRAAAAAPRSRRGAGRRGDVRVAVGDRAAHVEAEPLRRRLRAIEDGDDPARGT